MRTRKKGFGLTKTEQARENKGPFIYYVSTFIEFWTPLLPYISMFLVKISKNLHFLTPPPTTSAYVIYEWSLSTHDA